MKNKKVLICLALLICCVMATTGTIAYLQDTDSDVNVMTLGNVYITQNEQERVDTAELPLVDGNLKDFTQDKPLLPAVYQGDSIPWDVESTDVPAWKVVEYNKNVQDKFVTVTNDGNVPAYVRTIVAVEAMNPALAPDGLDPIHVVTNDIDGVVKCEVLYSGLEIGDQYFHVLLFTYVEPVAAKATTIPSLKQVYMDKKANNDHMAAFGETIEIPVLSQAVQADGFEDAVTALNEAFGEPTKENVKAWISSLMKTVVNDAAGLDAALANAKKGDVIELVGDFGAYTIDSALEGVTINVADGSTIKLTIGANADLKDVTIKGIKVDDHYVNAGGYNDGGYIIVRPDAKAENLVFEDCVLKGSGGFSSGVSHGSEDAHLTFKDCEFDGTKYGVYSNAAVGSYTFENCTFKNHSSWAFQINTALNGTLVMDGCTFDGCVSGIAKVLSGINGVNGGDSSFQFTNNTIVGSKGHDGKEAQWFTITADEIVLSGNTNDGAAWTPGSAQGLTVR